MSTCTWISKTCITLLQKLSQRWLSLYASHLNQWRIYQHFLQKPRLFKRNIYWTSELSLILDSNFDCSNKNETQICTWEILKKSALDLCVDDCWLVCWWLLTYVLIHCWQLSWRCWTDTGTACDRSVGTNSENNNGEPQWVPSN
jgi:hypothetical protein